MTAANNDCPRFDLRRLARVFEPESIAIVGASPKSVFTRNLVAALSARDPKAAPVRVHLISRSADADFPFPVSSSLSAVGESVDTVLSLVNAHATADVVAEADALGCGGVVAFASGFAELGADGAQAQQRLDAAIRDAGVVLVGPNCNGFVNATRQVNLCPGPPGSIHSGGVSVVTHSGAFIPAIRDGGADRGIGFALVASTGNEAHLDMADLLHLLAADPATRAICLVIEQIRRPAAFFAALSAASAANKPVVVLKLGTSLLGSELSRSHTGALLQDPALYTDVLSSAGCVVVSSVDQMLDAVVLFDQLPQTRWPRFDSIAVVSPSGGAASLVGDLCDAAGLELADLTHLKDQVAALVPGTTLTNPLDLKGTPSGADSPYADLISLYVSDPANDAVVLSLRLSDQDEEWSRGAIDAIARSATAGSPVILTSLHRVALTSWAGELPRSSGIATTTGIEAAVTAMAAMRRWQTGPRYTRRPPPAAVALPDGARIVVAQDTPVLDFAHAWSLLAGAGIPVAPCYTDMSAARGPGHWVVKLADAVHRAPYQLVEIGLAAEEVRGAAQRIARRAAQLGLEQDCVCQPQLPSAGELFIGGSPRSDLGPIVTFGAGGGSVESIADTATIPAPVLAGDVIPLLLNLRCAAQLGLRSGSAALAAAADAVAAASHLVVGAAEWLESIDINPLIIDGDRLYAVDVLMVTHPPQQKRNQPWPPQ